MFGLQLLVEFLEPVVLGCEAAFGCCVDDEDDLAGVGGEGNGLAFFWKRESVVSVCA